MKPILIAFTSLLLLSGCKATERLIYVDVPRVSVRIDSVYTYSTDSFIEKRNIKGDTIWQQRFKTLYKDRVSLKTDTITKIKTERITTVKEVKTKGVFWYLGIVSSILFSLLVVWKLLNYKFIKI